jgi:thiol-disulfide isomerase/thioredoxin
MMSGPVVPFSVQDELRRRFAVWSLAIFGSLSGTGSVQLVSSAWAVDDPPAESSTGELTKNAQDESTDAPLTRESLTGLIQAKKFGEAIERVDAALAKNPGSDVWFLNYILASNLSRSDPALAEERFKKNVDALGDQLSEKPSPQNISTFNLSAQSFALLLDRRGETKAALDVLDNALETTEAQPNVSANVVISLVAQRSRMLVKLGREDEARDSMAKRVDEALAKAQDTPTSTNRRALPGIISAYRNLFNSAEDAEQVAGYQKTAEQLLGKALDAEDAALDDYVAYQSLQIALASDVGRSDAKQALEVLEALQERASKFGERLDEAEQKRLLNVQTTLKAAFARLQALLLHETLIGQSAPEFEIAATVNMPNVTWSDLKGKVVLLDFWAVWCGPCIATFPHLQHWKQEYGDRGLVIVGVTRQYGYAWDTDAKRPVSNKEATLEEELAMLEHFRQEHQLEHGFVVTPLDSDFSRKFGVTGIPQAVLVDQNGKIQLIRVGSQEQNAADLEAKIRELLGMPAEAKSEKPAGASKGAS